MILALALLLATTPAGDAAAARQRAAQRFDEALMLVDHGDFAGAVVTFKEAYSLQPHPAVLLNLGQAYIALDRPREAVETLERFLRESGDELASEKRHAVEEQVRLQRARLRPPEDVPRLALRPAPTTAPPGPDTDARSSWQPSPYVAGLGLTALAGALALELSNQSRYHRWQSDRAAWERETSASEAGRTTHEERRIELNSTLRDIRRIDVIAGALGVSGALVAGVAAVIWLREPRLAVTSPRTLALQWTW
jgi:hypothetical protein